MHTLRKIMQGDSDLPKAPLGNNFRPVQTLNQRFLRTNIDFRKSPVCAKFSLSEMPIATGMKLLTRLKVYIISIQRRREGESSLQSK
jgi:hypothetical protein